MKLLIALFTAALAAAQPQGHLAWSDESNGAANTPPDSAKWTYDLGNNNGWGNRELENYTKDPENAHLDGKGNLVIRAETAKDSPNSYTSARIKTQGLFAASPNGRVEARIKVPAGAGIWPAFWMLGNTFNGRNWPACGEIDIMESLGREPSINHGSLHGPGYYGGKPMTSIYTLPDGRKFSDDYHVFAIDWKPAKNTNNEEDATNETVHDTDIPAGTQWVFD